MQRRPAGKQSGGARQNLLLAENQNKKWKIAWLRPWVVCCMEHCLLRAWEVYFSETQTHPQTPFVECIHPGCLLLAGWHSRF